MKTNLTPSRPSVRKSHSFSLIFSSFLALIGGSLGAGCQIVAGDFKLDTSKLKITCEPNATRCSDNQLQRCVVAGNEWQVLLTCPSANECDLATLTCKLCDPGSAWCNDAQPQHCEVNGSRQSDNGGLPCASAALCSVAADAADGASASCAIPVCSVGEVQCVVSAAGQILQRCRDDLSAWQPLEVCSSEDACNTAVAEATAAAASGQEEAFPQCDVDTSMLSRASCTAGDFLCDDLSSLQRCTPDGASFKQVEQCDNMALCNAELGRCVPSKCVSGATRCVGDVKQQCLDDLTGWKARPMTCGQGLCSSSADMDCETTPCTDGNFRCNDVVVQQCVKNVWTNVTQCDKAEQCDAKNGICKPAQ